MTTSQPELKAGLRFNPIWIVPFLALCLGAYMVVHSVITEGPEITIAFENASGLSAGKTKVKYRDVDVGLVTEVTLTDDFEGVLATVKMDYHVRDLLTPDTRFWVVTAQVGLGNITGLETLLSGAYVRMAPGASRGRLTREYTALRKPPLTPADAPGLRVQLLGSSSRAVRTGDPIIYKGYTVGRIESAEFDIEHEQMRYEAFVDAPFDELVNSSVRFWNTSGVSVSASAEGLRVRTGSLYTALLGGVAFGRPDGMAEGEPVERGSQFTLYESLEAARENPFVAGTRVVVRFKQSVKGLLPGAPVEYRGIVMGRVERLMIREMIAERTATIDEAGDNPSEGQPIPVLLYIEPGRFSLPDDDESVELMQRIFARGVPAGLRASLETANLLTGAKYISFDYHTDLGGQAELVDWLGLPEIPVRDGGVDQIMSKVNAILDQVNRAPIEATIANANAAIVDLNKVLEGLGEMIRGKGMQDLPANLDATLQQLQQTLDGLAPGSELYRNLNASMRQLERTLDNVESLTRTLSSQPNAAILPVDLPPDPQPEARR